MGNNQSTDPLKCTREQLQQIINSAIAHSPWINDDSGKKNQSEAEQRKILNNAVELMRVKGRYDDKVKVDDDDDFDDDDG